MANNAPTITWYLCDSSGSSASIGNTVDYDAVQAGNYSNIICVKPVMDGNNAATIGKVRFWWNDIMGGVQNASQMSLPANGWLMKYYVSYCDDNFRGSGTSGASTGASQANMMAIFSNAALKNALTSNQILSSTTSLPTQINNYCKATWQQANDKNYVCMQPIPFFTSTTTGFTHSGSDGQVKNFNNNYGGDWIEKTFGSNSPTKYNNNSNGGDELYYSVGGCLNNDGKGCNVTNQVSAGGQFPYIFLTIRPPTNADAGVWSGFSCRMSFVWPWTSTNTSSVSSVG